MRTTLSKLSVILYVGMILLMVIGLLLGCTTQPAGPSGQQETSAVRQPQGDEDLEAFWDKFDWTDLTPAEQALWQSLGWDEARWQGRADEPASESKRWSELTTEERSAAEQLGYDEQFWNE